MNYMIHMAAISQLGIDIDGRVYHRRGLPPDWLTLGVCGDQAASAAA